MCWTRISYLWGIALIVIVGCSLSAQGKYGGGSGEPNEPYQIWDANHIQAISADANDWDKCFILMADVNLGGITFDKAVIAPDLDDTTEDFIGTPFEGRFDGDGHRILNLTVDTGGLDRNFLGLFGNIAVGAVITDLGLENVKIIGSGNRVHYPEVEFTGGFGCLCGESSGSIRNCWVIGSVIGGNYSEDVGGLCGWSTETGKMELCYVEASVVCGPNSGGIGGLCGYNDGSIINCWASCPLTGRNTLGGLCGGFDGSIINNSYSTGSVNGTAEHLGGLVGHYKGGTISNCFWDVNTSGQETSAGGEGKTTFEMQDPNTFTNAGWDFITPIWMICGQDYPKLIWNYPNINGDDIVNFFDFAELAAYWMNFDCGMCGRTDLTGDRDIDTDDLRVFVDSWLNEDGISDHVFRISIEMDWDYEDPNVYNDTWYEFEIEVLADETVEKVVFYTPDQNSFEIPNTPDQRIDTPEGYYEIGTEYYPDEDAYEFDYTAGFYEPNGLAAFGDGEYTVTVHYKNGRQHQTTVWFGIPQTTDPLPQPIQKPKFTSFFNRDNLTSPVPIEWQCCTDPAASLIRVSLQSNDGQNNVVYSFPIDVCAFDTPLDLSEGSYDIRLYFEVTYDANNDDGIYNEIRKYSESDYEFTVE